MKSFLVALALTLSLPDADATTFTTNTSIAAGNTTYDGQDIVVQGCSLTVDGPHSFASLTLTSGALLTHSPAPNGEVNNRLNLTITGDVTVDSTSAINANGRGYPSGQGPGTVPEQGYQGPGAGHAGNGGIASQGGPGGAGGYGSATAPVTPGSGGGRASGAPGGSGGGVIRLVVAGTLTVNGTLSAAGNPGADGWYGGGGAGGSLWITAEVLAGNGAISVNGGQGYGTNNRAGGGGGGRLALYYGAIPFTGSVTAWGGTGYQRGGAGTIYRKPAAEPLGELLIDNGDVSGAVTPLTCEAPFHLLIANHALVYPTTALTLGNLQIQDRGTLFQMSGGLALDMVCYGDAQVAPTGVILADRTGNGANSGPGAGYEFSPPGQQRSASGAGHGGGGGQGEEWPPGRPGGPTYGFVTKPTTAGSGGGNLDVGLGG